LEKRNVVTVYSSRSVSNTDNIVIISEMHDTTRLNSIKGKLFFFTGSTHIVHGSVMDPEAETCRHPKWKSHRIRLSRQNVHVCRTNTERRKTIHFDHRRFVIRIRSRFENTLCTRARAGDAMAVDRRIFFSPEIGFGHDHWVVPERGYRRTSRQPSKYASIGL
jgi:hypothetical protein